MKVAHADLFEQGPRSSLPAFNEHFLVDQLVENPLCMHFLALGLAMHAALGPHAPTTHTTQPIVTGTTVIGIKYNGGVMLAADTLASYGSLARYKDVRRLQKVGANTLIGASGEISDFQTILEMLETMDQSDINEDDGYRKNPSEYFNYLRAVLYQKRGKGNPLWNQLLVAGYHNQAPFLGYVDLIGTAYEENFIATGFGAYLAIPLIREKWHAEMDEGEARSLLEDCLRVMFYRDCRALNRIQIAKATAEGTLVSEPYELATDWETANFDLRHSSAAVMDGSSW
jgi:20S proteasome subunit beta 7